MNLELTEYLLYLDPRHGRLCNNDCWSFNCSCVELKYLVNPANILF